MENLIYDYFISPIWDKTGYNVVNTVTYAVIALAAIYVIHRIIKDKINIDENFIRGVLPFVLLGSTLRVITDSVDSGAFTGATPIHQFLLDNHVFDYGYLTVSPGIYIVTASVLFLSMALLYWKKRMELLPYVGLALFLPAFLLLVPFMGYAIYAIPILALAAVPAYIAHSMFKDRIYSAIVAGQALDGAATFFIIDHFSKISGIIYFEQHVFSAGIGNLFGTYFTFYILKTLIAFAAIYVLKGEKMEQADKCFIALVLMIMGFAPGIRDILRMMIGA